MQTITITRTIDVPDYGSALTIEALKRTFSEAGSHFFDTDTMRFFRSRVDDHVYAGPDGWYFVTSEKHVAHTSYGSINDPRKWTVRRASVRPDGAGMDLFEFEAFQHFPNSRRAHTVARGLATTGAAVCSTCRLRLILPGTAARRCAECIARSER